jgi:YjeF-related protein N-terminus
MVFIFSLSSIIAAKTNIDQYYLKNSLMKMRRNELNYNKKVGVFGPRELTMNWKKFLSRRPNFVK